MNKEEKRYRVSALITSNLQIVVQAANIEEAEASAEAIDFDKWSVLSNEYQIVDVSKDFFERKLRVEQDTELLPTTDGPYLKIVKG